MEKLYVQIIVNNKSSHIDKSFTYIVNKEFIDRVKVGIRVVVPFGKGNKPITGIVISIEDYYETSYEVKAILDIIDNKPLISKELIELGLWIKEYYLSSFSDCFQGILPPGDFKEINNFVELIGNIQELNLSKDEEKIVTCLKNKGVVPVEELKKQTKISGFNQVLMDLEQRGIISTVIDIKTRIEKKYEKRVKLLDIDKKAILNSRAIKQRSIMEFLYLLEDVSFKELSSELDITLSTVKELEKKGLVIIYDQEITRAAIKREIEHYKKHDLLDSQKKVYDRILDSFNGVEDNNKFLIRGVTGSGKTEIYLQLVEDMLNKDKQSIILVPEISLTPQTIDRFVGRFGDLVAVLHSRLSQGERFDQWRRIKEGTAKIVVGARSAVFAPFNNLGLIIIDEEHEGSYKSSQNPKYDAIEVASKRVDIENAYLVMGSATPSIETYYNSLEGKVVLLELDERANQSNLPDIKVVDMREELNKGNKNIFSEELYESIENNLKNKKQTILFLNRRGYSTFVSCRQCGYVVKCNSCDISMTYYKNSNKLKCHYCGLAINPPKICPACKSNYIKYFGIGTEQIESYTKLAFPNAKIARMDMDTTTAKDSHANILESMKKQEIDILIGTQMISKGLDFKNVTLVGIIAADITLNLPDFRSPEKTFQLITQVAGRAGRGEDIGQVILQTYDPDNYSISYSKEHDYKGFYKTESLLRKEFLYPPFVNLISIVISGEDNNKVASITKEIYNLFVDEIYWIDRDNISDYVIGPYPAPLEKIKNNYRWQILLKSKKEYNESLKSVVKRVCIMNEYKLKIKDIKISVDIDPNSIL